jgi:hypothetical protein
MAIKRKRDRANPAALFYGLKLCVSQSTAILPQVGAAASGSIVIIGLQPRSLPINMINATPPNIGRRENNSHSIVAPVAASRRYR